MAIDVNMVAELNRKASAKNAERQQLIGRRDAAQQAFSRAVETYKAKYGVTLTAETLQSEYAAVSGEVERKYNELRKLISDIDNGVYAVKAAEESVAVGQGADGGQGVAGQEAGGQGNVAPAAAVEAPQAAPAVEAPATGRGAKEAAVVGAEAPVQAPVSAPVFGGASAKVAAPAQAQAAQPAQPAQAPVFGAGGVQSAPAQAAPGFGGAVESADDDISEQPVRPAGWGGVSEEIDKSFAEILGTGDSGIKFNI